MVACRVVAPLAGRVVAMSEVPDDIFADEIVGPGLAIDPLAADGAEAVVACAPIDGRIIKLFPHAFAVAGPDVAVLVHLGIDTVKLRGAGFEFIAQEGADVRAGEAVTRWHPAQIAADGLCPLVPVIVLDTGRDALTFTAELGTDVGLGDELLTVAVGE